MALERTFVMLKPDCVTRGLIGEVISRIEKKGLCIVAMKMIRLDEKKVDEHYAHLKDKGFYPELKRFVMASPVVAMVVEGVEAVSVMRDMCGPTNARKAPAGTIRGDFSNSVQKNVVHCSDSKETAEQEIKRFFKKEEVFESYSTKLVYADEEVGNQ